MKNLSSTRSRRRMILAVFIIVLIIAQCTVNAARHDKSVLYSVDTTQKVVALTYDDGPDPRFTPKLLDELNKYNVKATFFVIGQRAKVYPDLIQGILLNGHVIGNHTDTHPRDIRRDSAAQITSEIQNCNDVLSSLTTTKIDLFRPPRGKYNGSVLNVVKQHGCSMVLWTVCADHHDVHTPQEMADRVVRMVRPGSIILAHDGRFGTRWRDVAATPLIIKALKKQGYRFVTIPEMLEMKNKAEMAKNKPSNGNRRPAEKTKIQMLFSKLF